MGDDPDLPCDPGRAVQCPDEIANASPPSPSRPQQPLLAARCVNGTLVRPDRAEEESPSTACRQSMVTAPGGGGVYSFVCGLGPNWTGAPTGDCMPDDVGLCCVSNS